MFERPDSRNRCLHLIFEGGDAYFELNDFLLWPNSRGDLFQANDRKVGGQTPSLAEALDSCLEKLEYAGTVYIAVGV